MSQQAVSGLACALVDTVGASATCSIPSARQRRSRAAWLRLAFVSTIFRKPGLAAATQSHAKALNRDMIVGPMSGSQAAIQYEQNQLAAGAFNFGKIENLC